MKLYLTITVSLGNFLGVVLDEISFFLDQPHNPMVNSGAIMSAAILLNLVKKEMNIAKKFEFVFDFFKRMAGGEYLGFNNSIFLSERDSADRNFALAHFLRENDCFPPPSSNNNISDLLDFYFQVIMILLITEITGKFSVFCLLNGPSFGKSQLLNGVKLAKQNKNKMARKFKCFKSDFLF